MEHNNNMDPSQARIPRKGPSSASASFSSSALLSHMPPALSPPPTSELHRRRRTAPKLPLNPNKTSQPVLPKLTNATPPPPAFEPPKKKRGRPRKYKLPTHTKETATTATTPLVVKETRALETLASLSSMQIPGEEGEMVESPPQKRPRGRPRKHPLPGGVGGKKQTVTHTSSPARTPPSSKFDFCPPSQHGDFSPPMSEQNRRSFSYPTTTLQAKDAPQASIQRRRKKKVKEASASANHGTITNHTTEPTIRAPPPTSPKRVPAAASHSAHAAPPPPPRASPAHTSIQPHTVETTPLSPSYSFELDVDLEDLGEPMSPVPLPHVEEAPPVPQPHRPMMGTTTTTTRKRGRHRNRKPPPAYHLGTANHPIHPQNHPPPHNNNMTLLEGEIDAVVAACVNGSPSFEESAFLLTEANPVVLQRIGGPATSTSASTTTRRMERHPPPEEEVYQSPDDESEDDEEEDDDEEDDDSRGSESSDSFVHKGLPGQQAAAPVAPLPPPQVVVHVPPAENDDYSDDEGYTSETTQVMESNEALPKQPSGPLTEKGRKSPSETPEVELPEQPSKPIVEGRKSPSETQEGQLQPSEPSVKEAKSPSEVEERKLLPEQPSEPPTIGRKSPSESEEEEILEKPSKPSTIGRGRLSEVEEGELLPEQHSEPSIIGRKSSSESEEGEILEKPSKPSTIGRGSPPKAGEGELLPEQASEPSTVGRKSLSEELPEDLQDSSTEAEEGKLTEPPTVNRPSVAVAEIEERRTVPSETVVQDHDDAVEKDAGIKRKPGRPKKADIETAPKRKPGRPKKSEHIQSSASSAQPPVPLVDAPKRKPGRPRKSEAIQSGQGKLLPEQASEPFTVGRKSLSEELREDSSTDDEEREFTEPPTVNRPSVAVAETEERRTTPSETVVQNRDGSVEKDVGFKRKPGRPKKADIEKAPKRKPGRPRKSEHIQSSTSSAQPPVPLMDVPKRKPGRPRKSEAIQSGRPPLPSVDVPKRKPGRPRKEDSKKVYPADNAEISAPAPVIKRKPGRPRKHPFPVPPAVDRDSETTVSPLSPAPHPVPKKKRGPGRPRKHPLPEPPAVHDRQSDRGSDTESAYSAPVASMSPKSPEPRIPKKKRGRLRKIFAKESETDSPFSADTFSPKRSPRIAKRKPGRPRKETGMVSLEIRRLLEDEKKELQSTGGDKYDLVKRRRASAKAPPQPWTGVTNTAVGETVKKKRGPGRPRKNESASASAPAAEKWAGKSLEALGGPPKKKRGRPKKSETVPEEAVVLDQNFENPPKKKKRGRPRKHPIAAAKESDPMPPPVYSPVRQPPPQPILGPSWTLGSQESYPTPLLDIHAMDGVGDCTPVNWGDASGHREGNAQTVLQSVLAARSGRGPALPTRPAPVMKTSSTQTAEKRTPVLKVPRDISLVNQAESVAGNYIHTGLVNEKDAARVPTDVVAGLVDDDRKSGTGKAVTEKATPIDVAFDLAAKKQLERSEAAKSQSDVALKESESDTQNSKGTREETSANLKAVPTPANGKSETRKGETSTVDTPELQNASPEIEKNEVSTETDNSSDGADGSRKRKASPNQPQINGAVVVQLTGEIPSEADLATLPVAWAYQVDNEESEKQAMAFQSRREEEILQRTAAQNAAAKEEQAKTKSKKVKPKKIFEGRPTEFLKGGWPDGWKKKTFERMSGVTKGQTDDYWYSPRKRKKLRSLTEVKRFLEALDQCNGDEDKAYERVKKGRH